MRLISLCGHYSHAQLTGKIVMMILIFASVWSWGIIIQKFINYRVAKKTARGLIVRFGLVIRWMSCLIGWGQNPRAARNEIFAAGMVEWRRSHRSDGNLIAGAQARMDRYGCGHQSRKRKVEQRFDVLATVGAIAPFVGLFGTVWGIMNAFIEIAHSAKY